MKRKRERERERENEEERKLKKTRTSKLFVTKCSAASFTSDKCLTLCLATHTHTAELCGYKGRNDRRRRGVLSFTYGNRCPVWQFSSYRAVDAPSQLKTSQLTQYGEIIAVCSQMHTEHTNTPCGQNAELLNVKPGGTYSNHWRSF